MEQLDRLEAVAVPIATVNCDTDQILPAQFLQKLRSDDFGRYLFHEFRFGKDGSELEDFILNRAPYRPARILVAGRNFGCGSSREHAVWALYDYGFRAAIAPSFGDIFYTNALKNGFLPVVLAEESVRTLLEKKPKTIHIDLEQQTAAGQHFEITPFAKHCLIEGLDEIGYTLSQIGKITEFERTHG